MSSSPFGTSLIFSTSTWPLQHSPLALPMYGLDWPSTRGSNRVCEYLQKNPALRAVLSMNPFQIGRRSLTITALGTNEIVMVQQYGLRSKQLCRIYLGSSVQSLIVIVGLLGCSFLAPWEISWAKKPIGNFVTFTLYWGTMMFSLQRIAWSFRGLTSSLVGAERLLQLLDTKPTIAEQ